MSRLQAPTCPTCLRRHWEIMSTRSAAHHVHMRNERFRTVVAKGMGPKAWVADVYTFPRYHVDELNRWLAATQVAA